MDTTISNQTAQLQNSFMDSGMTALQSRKTAVAAISSSQNMEVNLVTAEGDKVTISLDAKAAALYGINESTEMDENHLAYRKTELSVGLYEREMSFTVEGELSSEERRDIRKVLKTLDRMMNHMVNGNLKPMMADAKRLKGLDTIASLEADMSVERQVLVASQTQQTVQTATGDNAAQPAATGSQANTDILDVVDQTADRMGQVVAEAETPMERMMSFVDQLLSDYRQQMEEFTPAGGETFIDRLSEQLHSALSTFNDLLNGGDSADQTSDEGVI